jgi:hypothetical protein
LANEIRDGQQYQFEGKKGKGGGRMPALSVTVFQDKVEDGRKRQSIRLATPRNRKQFKPGKLLKLYKGMYRRDYCKSRNSSQFGKKPDWSKCERLQGMGATRADCILCLSRGAKLLNQGPIIEVQVIKFKDLTQEIALADGFEDGWDEETCPCHGMAGGNCGCSALEKLKYFLENAYAAQPDTEFLIITWRPSKPRHICDVTGHSPAKGFHHECAGVPTCESCQYFNVERPPGEGKPVRGVKNGL